MSFICESGIGHVIGEFAQSGKTVYLHEKQFFKGFEIFIGWFVHEIVIEPIIDASICYTQETFYTVYNLLSNPISASFDLTANVGNFIYNNFNSMSDMIKTTLSFSSIAIFTSFSYSLFYNEEHKKISFVKLIPINMVGSHIIKNFYDSLFESSTENNNTNNLNLYPDIDNTTAESLEYPKFVIEEYCYDAN